MTHLYIARDGDGSLWQYDEKPMWYEKYREWGPFQGEMSQMEPHYYPDLKPGECARLVMERKEKRDA